MPRIRNPSTYNKQLKKFVLVRPTIQFCGFSVDRFSQSFLKVTQIPQELKLVGEPNLV